MKPLTTLQDLKVHDLSRSFDEVSRMPFGTLIGKILAACVAAQENASNAAWDYVQQVLSHEAPMVFTFQDATGLRRLEVPLVTIVPLPYIKLQDIKLDFDANVKVENEASSQLSVQVNSTSTESTLQQSAKSNANMHIDIDAGTVDMPVGLAALLGYMNDGFIVEDIPAPEPEPEPLPTSSGGPTLDVVIHQIDNNFSRPVPHATSFSSGSGSGMGPTLDEVAGAVSAHEPPSSSGSSSGRPSDADTISDEIQDKIHGIKPVIDPHYGVDTPDTPPLSSGKARPITVPDVIPHAKPSAPQAQLLALHVNWTKPSAVRYPSAEYRIDDFDILSTILSALLWRRLNGPIKLYTDSTGYAYYDSLGLLSLWNAGIDTSVLDHIPDDIPADIFWAGAKLFAIKHQSGPFVMMDTDLMVWENIQSRISGNDLMAYHTESLFYQSSCYIDYKFLKKRPDYKPNSKWDWNQDPYNTALTYFNNDAFVRYYTEKAIDFMRGNTERPLEMVSQMVFAEQRIFAMCAKFKNIPVATFLSSPFENNPAFTHIWGGKDEARNNPTASNRLCATLARAIVGHFADWRFSPQVDTILKRYID